MSASGFSIKSNTSDRELTFAGARSDHFVAELRGSGIAATREVYTYMDARGLADFFANLAACERPWVGTERWESLEGEFSIEAVCSAVGEITFAVRISSLFGVPEQWNVSARLVTELGQLPRIAAGAERFFAVVASA